MAAGAGRSLAEALVALGIAALALGAAIPATGALRDGGRLVAAARDIESSMQALRWKSVAEGRGHGLLFERGSRGWTWRVIRDGNGNGLRVAEAARGVDAVIDGPHRLGDRVPGVSLGFPQTEREFPPIPPGVARLTGGDPIRFGRSDLVAFGPLGGSSSGTIYLTDGSGLAAVRLFGPTARARVWRFDGRAGAWRR